MNTLSNGSRLIELAEKCDNNEKELLQASISLNKEFDHLAQKLKEEVEIVDNNISVNYFFFLTS